jgi:Xaa-Pro aminopeptidase
VTSAGQAARDDERAGRIRDAVTAHNLDALVCTVPSNVLLLCGYWPVIGNAIAIATRDGAVGVLAPDDEAPFASDSWADAIDTFSAGSLDALTTVFDAVRGALARLAAALGLRHARAIGFEGAESFDTSRYAATFSYGASVPALLSAAFEPHALVDATDMLSRLRSTLTPRELACVREACGIARTAFLTTIPEVGPGMREVEVAALLRRRLADPDHDRADGFAYCMSGPNSARAYAAYQRSTTRTVSPRDAVLIHCNSYCRGFWTDITRTFIAAPRQDDHRAMQLAIFAARGEAMAVVRAGVRASRVDDVARATMSRHGFGAAFRHPTGHGVGFAAINHNARPRVHPRSDDVLETGMVLNIEPAAYVEQFGMRHCDMIAVTDDGAELLTDFHNAADELTLSTAHASTDEP